MLNKILRLYILCALFSAAGVFAFADEPTSSLDDKPSVDTAASSGVQVPAVPSNVAPADTHTSYLYDLKKLIEKSRENIKEVNEKIKEQAVLKRNQKREERAHEYYEKGVELTNEGKLDEARDYFEKAIAITEHPEMVGYIKESQRRLLKQEAALHAQERQHNNQIKQDENTRKEDVEQAYREAIALYKQKKYHPAQDAFEHVDEIAPDYRATNSYLKLIEQDIILADALAVKQQAIEVARQQKEAEAARAKEKAAWLAQIEQKEKERKDAVEVQAAEVYDEAVKLYKNKKFAEAKKKFEEVSWVIPDYKATMRYLERIDRDAKEEEERVALQQQKAKQEQAWEETVEGKKQEAARQREMEIKELEHKKQLEEQAQFLYTAAVNLYDQKDMKDAIVKFTDIENTCPDYKSTRSYIARIEESNPELKPLVHIVPPAPVAEPVLSPEQSAAAASMENQQKEMAEISELARRAADLYSKIIDIADDRSTVQVKRKMARVDEILNNLKRRKEAILRQMHDELSRAQLEAHRDEAEKMYQLGRQYLGSHDYMRAKNEFLALENTVPDYRSTRSYLRRIDENLNGSNGQAETVNKQIQTEQLKQFQVKENNEGAALIQKQQAALQDLAQKASDINDDIIDLSRQQDYDAMKAKFTELENTITALTTIKNEMSSQKDRQKREKQLARESFRQREENHTAYQSSEADNYKRREMTQEKNMMFNEAVELYKEGKYTQAKYLFAELADQHDRRGEAWLKKSDRAINQDVLRRQVAQERERSEYIADQIKAQRELLKLQERERQHQKQLTEELERQKRLLEDQRAMEMRKEATMKAQEREREIQEEKRQQAQKETDKEQELLRFRKIETGANPNPAPAGNSQPALNPQPMAVIPSAPGVETRDQLEARREIVRKQLEDGVEAMYQEALSLYKQGDYADAADKFKDLQDIIPGYKNAQQYMDDARSKSPVVSPHTVTVGPDASGSSATPSVSHDDVVSKALDLFDPNAK
jgi:TolA-binding protein